MTIEDKILKVADQLAVMSQQRIIGLEKNIADLKIKLKKKTSERSAEIEKPKRRKVFKARENGTLRCPWCWILHGNTDLLSLSETATSSTAGLVIITFSSDKIAS
jgi:hypothetical protein